jgi:hypothetical protein
MLNEWIVGFMMFCFISFLLLTLFHNPDAN